MLPGLSQCFQMHALTTGCICMFTFARSVAVVQTAQPTPWPNIASVPNASEHRALLQVTLLVLLSVRSSSASSSSSTTSSYETARKSKVRESKTTALSAFRFQDKTRVLTQKPQFDPKDGAIVYSTMDTTFFKRQQAFKAMSTKWNKPYCCLKPTCTLCLDHKRTSRAELMLDVIKVLPCSARSNKKKFHQIVDRILSST